jgi:hypothetical protein
MMVNKIFSIYNSDEDFKVTPNQKVIVEVGKSHLASVIYDHNKKSLTAFELFDFKEEELADFQKLFPEILKKSKTVSDTSLAATVYINHEFCLPVPTSKFKKDIAEDYLMIVFGEADSSLIKYDHLGISPDVINVFRLQEDCNNVLTNHFSKTTFQHTYSNLISHVTANTAKYKAGLIAVHFYNTYIIVVVIKNGRFQLIQSIDYQASEDVIYYLLNISQQFTMLSEHCTILIAGMIDLNFKLYREMIKYFKNVQVENHNSVNTDFTLTEYPSHYFNSFFKLAL